MISYRFKRRAFMTAMSGGVGLKILLRNMEAAAQTTKSPARLLVSHWPVGIVAGASDALWKPSSSTTSVDGSIGLKPFADAGLGADMTTFRGLYTPVGAGGSHEGGTPALVSGVAPKGTRSGEQESDDAYSDGPSIDQYLLANVPALKSPNSAFSYKNAGCDTRTDFGEVSTKCLSYSTMKQTVAAFSGPGMENAPLPPTLSPLTMYNDLFMNFVPTANFVDTGSGFAAAAPAADATLTNLAKRRSVLDFAAKELNALRTMGPADARMKLDNHYNAVLAMENNLTDSINRGYPTPTGTGGAGGGMGGMGGSISGAGGRGGTTGSAGAGGRGGTTGSAGAGGRGGTTGSAGAGGSTGSGGTGGSGTMGCKTKPTAPPNVMGAQDKSGGLGNPYGTNGNIGQNDDSGNMQMVGAAHFSVLKAAFICDIIRCGTFLWAPGTNHTGFKLFPNSSTIYMHHPTSHHIQTNSTESGSSVAGLPNDESRFLFAVQQWFFTQQAANLKDWKNSFDGYGNSLLDYTVVPYVTEVRATQHERDNMPGMIIGGKLLGYKHNVYNTTRASINQFWGTVAQAFGYTGTGGPVGAPIANLWTKPA